MKHYSKSLAYMTFLNTLTRNSDNQLLVQQFSIQEQREEKETEEKRKIESRFGHFPERDREREQISRVIKRDRKEETY